MDQPLIKLFGGPFDGQTIQVPEKLAYFEWPHNNKTVTYVQSSPPSHYHFQTEEHK